jgi:hypothetical protein
MQPRVSVAPFRGLVRFRLYPEFRFAPLRALIPPHPSGASWIGRECRTADGRWRQRGRRAGIQPGVPLRANPGLTPPHPSNALWLRRGWRMRDGGWHQRRRRAGIQPGVERSGTPGTRHLNSPTPAKGWRNCVSPTRRNERTRSATVLRHLAQSLRVRDRALRA